MKISRRFAGVCLSMLAALASSGTASAAADEYPARPVRVIVPYPPGATTDFMGRLFADHLRAATAQSVTVENIGGASGTIGAAAAAKAPADGHNLLVFGGSLAAAAQLYKDLPFVPMRDLVAIGTLARIPTVFAVHKDVPARTLAELVALARQAPGKYNYVSPGSGTPPHVAALQFAGHFEIALLHVPYRGIAPAVTDLVAGRGHLVGVDVSPILPHIQAGTLRALAVAADKRIAALPDVPTAAEAGFPGYEHYAWWGVFAPRGTPPTLLDRLNAILRAAVTEPAIAQKLQGYHAQPLALTRTQTQELIEADYRAMGEMVRKYGISPSN